MSNLTMLRTSVLFVAAATLTAGEVARRWIYSGTKNENDPLGEDDPAGFHPRNEIIWKIDRAVILPIGYINYWLGNLELEGIENLQEAEEQGKGNQLVANHTSILDTFLPQLIMWFHGFEKRVEDLLHYSVGVKFVNRRPLISKIIKGGSYYSIVPPAMLKRKYLRTLSREDLSQHLINAKRINTSALLGLGESLSQGIWTLLFPEGTRVPKGSMRKVHQGVAGALRHPGTNIQAMAIVGLDLMWPPGSWLPKLVGKAKIILGKPTPYEELDRQAKELNAKYNVTENQALVDLVARQIAVLLIDNGHKSYAGFYAEPNEDRYEKRQGWEER